MPTEPPLKFNEEGDLVAEILPCGCNYEVFSENFICFTYLTQPQLSMLEMWLVEKKVFV